MAKKKEVKKEFSMLLHIPWIDAGPVRNCSLWLSVHRGRVIAEPKYFPSPPAEVSSHPTEQPVLNLC